MIVHAHKATLLQPRRNNSQSMIYRILRVLQVNEKCMAKVLVPVPWIAFVCAGINYIVRSALCGRPKPSKTEAKIQADAHQSVQAAVAAAVSGGRACKAARNNLQATNHKVKLGGLVD